MKEIVDSSTLIQSAAGQNNLEAVQELIKRGAELNTNTRTPLGVASTIYLLREDNMMMPVIPLLLKNGADPYKKRPDGGSVFDFVNELEGWKVFPRARQLLPEKKKTLIDLFEQYSVNIKPAKR